MDLTSNECRSMFQAFYYAYKNAGTGVASTFGTFPEALHVTFQMSLGAFRVGKTSANFIFLLNI